MTAGHQHVHAAPAPSPAGTEVKSWKLLATLAIAGAMAGTLVVLVYQVTLPSIQRYAGAKIEGAVREVLRAPAKWDTLYLVGDKLQRTAPTNVDIREAPKMFVGYNAEGARTGVAVEVAEPGFLEELRLMVGFDPATRTVTGYTVLDQKETPGLGDKIERDTGFVAQFRGKVAPMKGVRSGTTTASTVQTITGATISSRAVIRIINNTVAMWQPRVQAFDQGGGK
jgi:electron transport complex protein RnfG